jgi:hypothetical protein
MVDSAPSFRPGSFPVVFNASAEEASVDVWFTPDIQKVGEHSDNVYASLGSSDKFTEFLANSNAVDAEAEERLASHFEASSMLCAAQSICAAHQTAGFPVGDFSPLVSSDLVHVQSIRQITSQYGDVRFDRVGQRYSVKHYTQTIKAFIRQAHKAFKSESLLSRIEERTCWWLPVERHDPRTKFILACRLADLVKSKNVGFVPDPNWLEDKILPANAGSPPVWLPSVLSEEEVNTLSPLWSAFPQTPAEFTTKFGGPTTVPLLELLSLSWASPEDADLGWRSNWKEMVSAILDRWAGRAPVLRRTFETADKSVSAGSSGSTAQLGKVDLFRGVHIASFSLDNGSAISSLATAFLPKAVFSPQTEVDVRYTTTTPLGERAVAWVQRDFR